MIVSIFNDVIGPVMRGPSSSHCAAALRIGRLARDLMDGDFHKVLVEFDRNGSLPTTHESQGSDMGLFGGLLGLNAADECLPDSPQMLRDAGVTIQIETVDTGDEHPNTYRLTLYSDHEQHTLIAISTGGGIMEVINIDGFDVSMSGGVLSIEVTDNGKGLSAEDLAKARSFGIRGLHERAETVGGWVDISSNPDGTTLILSVPLSGPDNGFIERLLPDFRDTTSGDMDPDDPTVWG